MHQNVCDEEGEEEPHRLVTPKGTCPPQMLPLHRLYGMVEAVNLEGEEDGVNDETYRAPRHIRHEQPLRLVPYVCPSVARDGLVEISRLEEKEAHEEERPRHDLFPPPVALMAAEGDGVQTYHADDADAAQKVEGVIAFFHLQMLFPCQE